ncbi:MAG TPA: hypothetical protein VMV15_08725 [Candidatus Binataceae bacterium]|nr:hypothetical protein [Candidatus Binataceae bacterium]
MKSRLISIDAASSVPRAALAAILLTIAAAGCASSTATEPSSASAAQNQPQAAQPIFDVSGVWEGQSRANCAAFNPLSFNTRCNAINRIALTMVQGDKKITGFYKCSVGNTDCRNQNDSGTIASGSMKNGRLVLRVGMPDGSSCLFNGARTAANQIRGNYSCYQGGGLAEQGRFEVKRNY